MCSKVRVNIVKAPASAPTVKAKGVRCVESEMDCPESTKVAKSASVRPVAAQGKRNNNPQAPHPSLNSHQTELRLFNF